MSARTAAASRVGRPRRSARPGGPCRLFVAPIPDRVGWAKLERDIRSVFGRFGTIARVVVHKRFAFVAFDRGESAQAAIDELHGTYLFGQLRRSTVELAGNRAREGSDRSCDEREVWVTPMPEHRPEETIIADLHDTFGAYGTVEQIRLRHRCAIIRFSDACGARAARYALDGWMYIGRRVRVDLTSSEGRVGSDSSSSLPGLIVDSDDDDDDEDTDTDARRLSEGFSRLHHADLPRSDSSECPERFGTDVPRGHRNPLSRASPEVQPTALEALPEARPAPPRRTELEFVDAQVDAFLSRFGFSDWIDVFRKEEIDIDSLYELTDDSLKVLGFSKMGQRLRFQRLARRHLDGA
ncbi:unnamed protein product (mitochondrion) [Plasmodiophora brassicae]|uniref:SAM domain-containing protein n=1 Tax=Plasmodiophora brassicae TaxID=37360 RepID=A0A0G4IR37_PLABS|nr:hypothetical protein PBRA_000987 [Plasmodiophora brassicae]SPQ97939.1 unnamed protein product [Plasmodiophora brassicae]